MKIEEALELQKALARVLVVDDSPEWQRLVQTQLDEHPHLLVSGFASDGMEAVEKAHQLQPDLILLDVGMPRLNGIDAARQIRDLAPRSLILFVSQNTDPDVVFNSHRAGGRGFVLKTAVVRDLVAAVEAVLRGESFISRELVDNEDPT